MQSSICVASRHDQNLQHLWSNTNIKEGAGLIPYHSAALAKVTKVQMLGLPLLLTTAWEWRREGCEGTEGSSFTADKHSSSS